MGDDISLDPELAKLLMSEFSDYLAGHTRARMESFRKPKDGPDALPEACRNGTCEHLEHAKDEELGGW